MATTAGPTPRALYVKKLRDLHDNGKLTDDEMFDLLSMGGGGSDGGGAHLGKVIQTILASAGQLSVSRNGLCAEGSLGLNLSQWLAKFESAVALNAG